MSRQQINSRQNITFPTTEVPPVKREVGKPKTFMEKREAKSDDYAEEARTSAQTGYDTENQLSSNLITVTLAFVALISVAISSRDLIIMLDNGQKWTILSALIIFCVSILMGLINYFYNMRYHQKTAVLNDVISKRADKARSTGELEKLEQLDSRSALNGTARNITFILLQISLMITGLILVVAFVGTLLFSA